MAQATTRQLSPHYPCNILAVWTICGLEVGCRWCWEAFSEQSLGLQRRYRLRGISAHQATLHGKGPHHEIARTFPVLREYEASVRSLQTRHFLSYSNSVRPRLHGRTADGQDHVCMQWPASCCGLARNRLHRDQGNCVVAAHRGPMQFGRPRGSE